MGRDKASLKIGGITQLERILTLLRPLTEDIFLSVAHDDSTARELRGLQAAFQNDPQSNWLVIACDLPLIQQADLQLLVDQHNESKDATCFLNPLDQHPEPLCALYSPSTSPKLNALSCARRFLASLERSDLTPSHPQALHNLNRPEHLAELEHLHQHGAIEKQVTVEYFAKLNQEAGIESEDLRTSAATLAGLWEEVRLKHHFTLDLPHINPAVDNEFAEWTTPLNEGQTIAFMPPFAGG